MPAMLRSISPISSGMLVLSPVSKELSDAGFESLPLLMSSGAAGAALIVMVMVVAAGSSGFSSKASGSCKIPYSFTVCSVLMFGS